MCKNLLAKKYTLARIMQSCMREYRNYSLNDIAENFIEGQPEIGKTKVLHSEFKVQNLFCAAGY